MSIKTYLHPPTRYIILPREWDIACWNPLTRGGVEHVENWPSMGLPHLFRQPYVCDPKDRPVDSWEYLPEFFDAFPQKHRFILTYNKKEPLVGPVCFLAGEEDYLDGVFVTVPTGTDTLVAQRKERRFPKP